MSEHLSALQLDEIAAGLVPAPEHATSCAQCMTRLEELRKQSAAFLERPEAKQQLQRLLPSPPRASFLRVLTIALPLAAGLVLFFAFPRAPVEDRIKGAPTVMLLDDSGQAVQHAAPGQKLTLAVGSAGFARVRVVAVDAAGKSDELFSGPISAGAKVPLMQLEVTPGDVTVIAEFEGGTTASVKLAVP